RVVLARTGEGRELAMQGLEAVAERFHVDRVFVVGVAGGLSPELESGAVIVANRVMQGATELPSPDAGWLDRALDGAATVPGVIVSARRILGTAAEKQGALAALGGDAPAAVDLESAG
ncbi:MAG: hypothetical protein GWN07_27335, partial [Actinobacteria bacterium]|nr:hypothetical protein [Actinomycetota bacterium]